MVLGIACGCEWIQTAPPAQGRVVDSASGQPLPNALVVRTSSDASNKKYTNKKGEFSFRGRWRLQPAIGGYFPPDRSYVIEANGYRRVQTNISSFTLIYANAEGATRGAETNRSAFGWANEGSVTDELGTIPITPK